MAERVCCRLTIVAGRSLSHAKTLPNPPYRLRQQFAYSFDGGPRFRQLLHHGRNTGLVLANQKNFRATGEGLTLDQMTPEFVAESMEELELVLFEPVRVRLLR